LGSTVQKAIQNLNGELTNLPNEVFSAATLS